ncbi:MAG: pantoate--beta-alanine ligase [Frankiaceae bacterium]|nr:pantoate--beta-alanine ligase [Frankiaceae bacterium]
MTAPRVVTTREELAEARRTLPGRVAVVMTMGALHEGHAVLIRTAQRHADHVVVTVFVNPLQFGPNEDLDRYPRTFDADLAMCARAGADVVFAPTVDVMYPYGDPLVRVSAGPLGERLEGAHRPGHFDGVLTVVAKLLQLTRPVVAVFGEKDAQQLALVKAMVRDLDLGVEIVGVPTVREADGLALSSRNAYLSPDDRRAASALHRALSTGELQEARAVLDAEPAVTVDYLELVDDETWTEMSDGTTIARLLVAARVGTTRLIDNVSVHLGTRPVG